MISFTSAQLTAWIVAFIYPVARILAFASTAPFLNNPSLPRRTRLLLGLALAVSITPTLAPMPAIVPTSAAGILLLIQQILIMAWLLSWVGQPLSYTLTVNFTVSKPACLQFEYHTILALIEFTPGNLT